MKIDRAGYFDTLSVLDEDVNRTRMYIENSKREVLAGSFDSYDDYLASLQMEAEIAPFREEYYDRIHQLINKTNQFNLTSKRCSREDVVGWSLDPEKITIFARLADKFGDNGLTSVVIANIKGVVATVDLWLMSCRVIKRGLEFAMMEVLLRECNDRGLIELRATYKKSQKNIMVQNLLKDLGFSLQLKHEVGDTDWRLLISDEIRPPIHKIKVNP
jgi:FkbH-like protein